ncbi:hypothetical protein BU17DRAFT_88424 [Hysterangium stoloniferum]|nr:hypothetical protein BU17DRAFT_88424 [Hysterangium stoloniferum]
MIVAFGPSLDSYFIAHGAKFYAERLPKSLHSKIASGDVIPAHMSWMSIAKDGQCWAADNTLSGKIWWDSTIGKPIQKAFMGIPPAPPSNYVSFSEQPNGYFLKGINPGAWSAELDDIYVNSIRDAQRDIDGFDLGLTRIMFGVGGSHIFCFDNGFQAKLQGIHDHPDNALHKVLQEFALRGPGWTIGPGSALSLHDPNMFVLVFQHIANGVEEIRWVGPQEMSDRITELIKAASSPDEQAGVVTSTRDHTSSINVQGFQPWH